MQAICNILKMPVQHMKVERSTFKEIGVTLNHVNQQTKGGERERGDKAMCGLNMNSNVGTGKLEHNMHHTCARTL